MKSRPEPVMNKPTKINSSRPADFISTDRIFYLSTLLLVFSLPYNHDFSVISFLVFGCSGILYLFKNKNALNTRTINLETIVFFSLYPLVSLISIIYSSNLDYAVNKVENLVFLLLIPLFLFVFPTMNKKRFDLIIITFCLACFLSTIYPMIRIFEFYLRYKEITLWVIDDSIYIHRAYLGMYLVLCLFLIFCFFYDRITKINRIRLIGLMLLFFYLLFFLILSLSKMAIVSCIILFLLGIMQIRYKILERFKRCVIFIPAYSLILTIVYININLHFFERPFDEGEKMFSFTHDKILAILTNSSNVRFTHWSNAYNAWINSFKSLVFGYGIGDAKDILNQFYLNNQLDTFASGNFNAHNTYLQISLATGLIGLISFIFLLIKSLQQGLKSKNYFLVFFIILFVICSSTESMLMRQKGVLFFAIFLGLFSFHWKSWNLKHPQ